MIQQMTNIAEHFYITTKQANTKIIRIDCTTECLKIINKAIKNGLSRHEKGRLH